MKNTTKKKAKKRPLIDERTGMRKLNESHQPGGFETHVRCSNCNSPELQLSVHKTKLKCNKCGNQGLVENIVGIDKQSVQNLYESLS